MQNAKPGHFVALGVGISGIYLYNTDTVEVSQDIHNFCNYSSLCGLEFYFHTAYCTPLTFTVYNKLTSCLRVIQMTGRRRFNIVSSAQELKMGEESYREVLQSERGKVLPDHHPLTKMVNGVLQRLIPQVDIEGADWRVHVIQDDGMVNAFVLPG